MKRIGQSGLLVPIYRGLERHAFGAEPPRRVVILAHPDGVNQQFYWPSGSGTNITFNQMYYPMFDAWKSKLTMWRGLRTIEGGKGSDGDHANGILSAMTGVPAPGPNRSGGISVDQHIADQLFGKGVTSDANKKVLNLGVVADQNNDHGRLFYDKNLQAIQPFNNPADVVSTFFGGIAAGGSDMAPAMGNATSGKAQDELNLKILDATLSDIDRLLKRVPSAEKPKLEAQKSSLLDVRKAIGAGSGRSSTTPPVASCTKPMPAASLATRDMRQTDAITDAHIDIIVAALVCDLSRVVTLQWANGVSGVGGFAPDVATKKIISKDLHSLSHMAQQENADPVNDSHWYASVNSYYATKVAKLAAKLASIPEGSGTLLDSTCILWTSEFAQGTHQGNAPSGGRSNKVDHPTMFLGTLGKGAMAGFQTASGGFPRALQTLCDFMGVPPMGMAGAGMSHKSLLV